MDASINDGTIKLGVIGSPISHSLSPLIQNYMIKKLNLNYFYQSYHVEENDLDDFLESVRILNIKGFNVTIPHKQNIYFKMNKVFEDAAISKSVNTVKFTGEEFYGYSTDGEGFRLSLEEAGESFKNKKVLIIGAGGAARALIITAANCDAEKITVLNRTLDKAKKISDDINNSYVDTLENLNEHFKENDIIINCTPLGMKGISQNFEDFNFLKSSKKTVCDLIYNPLETELLKKAKEKGHKTLNGLGMLIYQGILALEIFTDVKIDRIKMKEDVFNFIKGELNV